MKKVTLKIDGMMCGMCEAHINDVIRKAVPDAKKVVSSHKKGETTFLTEEEPDEVKLSKAIEDTGYAFLSMKCEPQIGKGLFHFGKN